MSSLATQVGLRYVNSGSEHSFVSFISRVSMLGISLGVAVLIIVLSVMNGFESELRQRILSLASHATITDLDYRLANWTETRAAALGNPSVVGAAPYVEDKGMLVFGEEVGGALIRGVLPELETDVAEIESVANAVAGLSAGEFGIVLGQALADALDVQVGDKVWLIISEARVTPVGLLPRMKRFTVAGTFSVGMYEFDRGLAYVHMDDAQKLYRLGGEATGLRLRLDDMERAPEVVREVARALGGGYYVNDWTRTHANFFHSVRLTKAVLFVILSLIVAVAAFNIVSTLVLVVREKHGDIAILRTMGVTPGSVLKVFVVQGVTIGLIGTAAGVLLGSLLAFAVQPILRFLEWITGQLLLDPTVYLINDLPARIEPLEIVLVAVIAIVLSVLSTIYPALHAARTEPARALRHE